jgi:uncharacterized protein (DUF2164 family)
MAIELPPDAAKQVQQSIKRFFAEYMDDEIGDLKARIVMEFCLKEIGPSIYNQAIADAQKYFQDRVMDLEGSCYEKEFGFWK